MATVPAPADFAGGVVSTTTANANIRDPLKYLMRPPLVELRQTSAQSLTTGVSAAVTFNAEDADTDVDGTGGHDNVTNNSRFTARYAGWYQASGAVGFAGNATGRRGAVWFVNGVAPAGGNSVLQSGSASAICVPARTKHLFLDVGDYVELYAYQESGGALNTAVTSAEQSQMTVRWVSR